MSNAEEYLRKLRLTMGMREGVIQRAIDWLEIPLGSRGLDAGCGEGSLTLMLAEMVGADGHITGVDIEPYFLSYAKEQAFGQNMSERVSFERSDIENLKFADGSFDWMWSVDCGCYNCGDHLKVLKEFARVVKPGGFVAAMFYSSQMLLPGYPELEARLNSTRGGMAPYRRGVNPDSHPFRLMKWFREAGMMEVKADTFVETVQAPLTEDMKEALKALIDMRWEGVESELGKGDWNLFQKLINPESAEYILDRPDYYGFFTYTVFKARVSQAN